MTCFLLLFGVMGWRNGRSLGTGSGSVQEFSLDLCHLNFNGSGNVVGAYLGLAPCLECVSARLLS
jgi:hypothetical protein